MSENECLEFNKTLYQVKKNLGLLTEKEKRNQQFEREYNCEFLIAESTDEVWLDNKIRALRTEYWSVIIICVYCKKEIKVYYDKRNNSFLKERLQGKLCPNCNQVSLRL